MYVFFWGGGGNRALRKTIFVFTTILQLEKKIQKEFKERDDHLQEVVNDVAHSLADAEQAFRHLRESLSKLIVKRPDPSGTNGSVY